MEQSQQNLATVLSANNQRKNDMRNIKFRHFDTRHNEMRYSDKHDGEFYINLKGVLYMYAIPKSESGLSSEYYKSYDVMQYTGVDDKNGTPIFEGDIVEGTCLGFCDDDEFKDVVEFSNGSFCFSKEKWKDGTYDWYSLENYYSEDLLVVGNIYENPELL